MKFPKLKKALEFEVIKYRWHDVTFPIGSDEKDNLKYSDFWISPHLFVGGENDSERFSLMQGLIESLKFQNKPDKLRLIIIEPKKGCFSGLSKDKYLHFPIIENTDKAMAALRWCHQEMERRYIILANNRKKDVSEYNENAKKKIPFIFVFISDLTELMIAHPKETERLIVDLLLMARIIEIHMIVSSKNLSRKILTPLLAASFPMKVVFKTATKRDSMWLLNNNEAEKLSGKGELFFQSPRIKKDIKLQSFCM